MNGPILIAVDGGPIGTLDAFLKANAGLINDEHLARLQSLAVGETAELAFAEALPCRVTRHANHTVQLSSRPAAEPIPDVIPGPRSRYRKIPREERSRTCHEPLLVIAEGDASEVYGCGPCGCSHDGTPDSGVTPAIPTLMHMETFRGVEVAAETVAERPLSKKLSAALAEPVKGESCIPWWRITRDPQRFTAIFDKARAGGPVDDSAVLYERIKDELQAEDQEVFVAVLLDTQLNALAMTEIARGAREHVEAPIADVLRAPLVTGAYATIVVHNHPAGEARPSKSDTLLTQDLVEAFRVANICLIDHIIVGREGPRGGKGYYSFRDAGVIKDFYAKR